MFAASSPTTLPVHERHAGEQAAALERAREPRKDDTSVQDTVNKVVVILRDWLSDLDRDALPAVTDGEESIRKEYVQALDKRRVAGDATISALRPGLSVELSRLHVRTQVRA